MIEHKCFIEDILQGRLLVRTVHKCGQQNKIDRISRNRRPLKIALNEKTSEIVTYNMIPLILMVLLTLQYLHGSMDISYFDMVG